MNYRIIGSTGMKVSAIGLGTWAIGGGPWWGTTDDAESISTIHAAIDTGINLIDTAPVYGFGRSEKIVGKAVKGRRDKLIISTKCGLWWNDARGAFFFEQEGRKVNRSLRPDTMRLEIEQSLKHLGIDCIDIYHTHWPAMPPEKTPIKETMECLLKLKAEGKIRSIAVSNADCAQMDEYRRAGIIVANQPRYSMLDRTIETELVPYCLKHNISMLVYSPLEQGLLTGKIGMDKKFAESEHRNSIAWFRLENRRRVLNMLSGWKKLAKQYDCTIAQLVLAWTISQPGITAALCGARHPEQIHETAKAGEIFLADEDIRRMRKDAEALGTPNTG
ncbi:MAG: aldo/keto reductase [Kiritimatiellia bacterium]|nr:aldo/keto reductase [Kiritimatiellia bacterium]